MSELVPYSEGAGKGPILKLDAVAVGWLTLFVFG